MENKDFKMFNYKENIEMDLSILHFDILEVIISFYNVIQLFELKKMLCGTVYDVLATKFLRMKKRFTTETWPPAWILKESSTFITEEIFNELMDLIKDNIIELDIMEEIFEKPLEAFKKFKDFKQVSKINIIGYTKYLNDIQLNLENITEICVDFNFENFDKNMSKLFSRLVNIKNVTLSQGLSNTIGLTGLSHKSLSSIKIYNCKIEFSYVHYILLCHQNNLVTFEYCSKYYKIHNEVLKEFNNTNFVGFPKLTNLSINIAMNENQTIPDPNLIKNVQNLTLFFEKDKFVYSILDEIFELPNLKSLRFVEQFYQTLPDNQDEKQNIILFNAIMNKNKKKINCKIEFIKPIMMN